MIKVKEPNVAGTFYPSNKDELLTMVEVYLNERGNVLHLSRPPKAIISPHAGYIFSGPIAASAYRELIPVREQIKRVAVLSPSHFCDFKGIALSSVDGLRTPLGLLSVDHSLDSLLLEYDSVEIIDGPFEREHALEVQLPFIQVSIGEIDIIPMIVSSIDDREMGEIIDLLIANDTLVIVSTDLSHFHNYDECCGHDKATQSIIESHTPELLRPNDACGHFPLRGLLQWCQDHDSKIEGIDVRNSGDTAGDKVRVVGYGAWIVTD